MTTLTARIEFVGDWRIGAGPTGPGGVDRAGLRDRDGLPIVPAKSLTGVWREAAEHLAARLDTTGGEPEHGWTVRVLSLFGAAAAQGEAQASAKRVVIRPARLPEDLALLLRRPEHVALRRALSSVRAGVRLDARHVALPDHLRFDEAMRAGIVLLAPVTIRDDDLDDHERRRILALLQGSAAFIDAIGASRRRGMGACRVAVEGGLASDDLVSLLDASAPPRLTPRPRATPGPGGDHSLDPDHGGYAELRLDLTALTPLLTAPTVTGNIHTSADRIPGANLLSVMCAAIDAVWGAGSGARAVRDGNVRVSDARPQVGRLAGRPTPLCLVQFKHKAGFADRDGVRNLFAAADDPDPASPAQQIKPLRGGYIGDLPDGRLPEHRAPTITQRVHNVIDDLAQRPLSTEAGGAGGVYVYGAIESGERFVATVRLRGRLAERAEQIAGALPVEIEVGRSKHDDYGHMEVRAALSDPSTPKAAVGDDESFSVWLLSDMLPPADLASEGPVEALLRSLERALIASGAPEALRLHVAERQRENRALAQVAARAARSDGWQTSWGLPRGTLRGVAGGSCAIVNVTGGGLSADVLCEVSRWGVGARTVEGFGDVAFADPAITASYKDREPAPASLELVPEPTGSRLTGALPELIEDVAWRAEIRWAAVALAETNCGWMFSGAKAPGAAQLGRLRQVALARDSRAALLHLIPPGSPDLDPDRENARKKKIERWERKGWPAATLRRLRELAERDASALFDDLLGAVNWGSVTLTDEAACRERHADYALAAIIDATVRRLALDVNESVDASKRSGEAQ